MLPLVLVEIRAVPAERSRGRRNPRAIKRKVSAFPTRSRAASASPTKVRFEDHIRVTPPAVPDRAEPAPAPGAAQPPSSAPSAPRHPANKILPSLEYHRHVQAWRTSGLSHADYCQQHDLNQRVFHNWVARLRPCFRRPGQAAKPKP